MCAEHMPLNCYKTEEEFWNARPWLTYIRDYARAKTVRVAPWALLFTVFGRLAVAVPPHVVIPPLAGGSPMGLNIFVALVGDSGDGKGLTERAARNLMPDIRKATTTQPASGEGMAALFAKREMDDEQGESLLKCINPRALLSIPEVTALGGAASRSGSILVPTLTSAFSGEQLGGWNKSETNRLLVPELGYRVVVITGVQPANLDVLMRESGTGLPQRFFYAYVRDYDAPENAPVKPAERLLCDVDALPDDLPPLVLNTLYQAGSRWNMLNNGGADYPLTYLQFPEEIADIVDRDAYIRLHGLRENPLDAHGISMKLKLAALFALMENRLDVTMDDWRLAEYVYRHSSMVRDDCIQQADRLKRDRKADSIALDNEARAEAENRKAEQIKSRILEYLAEHDQAREGVKGYKIRQHLGRDGNRAYEIIETLYAEGKLDVIGADGTTSSRLWTLSADR